jgi:hypothetical protein
LALTRVLNDYEIYLRSELLAGHADPYEISSPRDELEKFRFFARQVQEFINQAEQSEVESLRLSVQHLPKDTQDDFWMWNYPIHWDEIFRSTFRFSIVVSLATFLETFMRRLCYRVALVTKSELSAAELEHFTLQDERKFLQAVGRFQKPIQPAWDEIGLFKKIRNVIVHNAGFTAKSKYKKAIETFCRNRSDIRLRYEVIEIDPEFIEFMINQLVEFVDQLGKEFMLLCERTRALENS